MKKNYYLYLDESKPNGNNIHHLCLAGVIIEKSLYEQSLVPSVNILKNDVFGHSSVILHEIDLRNASVGDFQTMRITEKRDKFWGDFKTIFKGFNFKTIGAAVHVKEYRSIYSQNYLNDEYFIALQIVLENFVHFLEANDGMGTVYIESTNPADDKKLKNIYYKIIANGTLYLNSNIFQDRLFNINFNSKVDNIIGLQVADFIPGQLNRSCNSLAPKKYSLFDEIESKLYDGGCSKSSRFGFKIMP